MVQTFDLMPPNSNFAQCKCHRDVESCAEAVVLIFARPCDTHSSKRMVTPSLLWLDAPWGL